MALQNKKLAKKHDRVSYYREYEASPIFSFKNAPLTTLKSWLLDFSLDDTSTQKYLPFTTLQFTNNSDYDIYIYPNQDSTVGKVIPAGVTMTFDRKTIPATRTLKIYNAGTGTIAENEIEVAVWKDGVAIDNAFANMHKAFFKFLYKN